MIGSEVVKGLAVLKQVSCFHPSKNRVDFDKQNCV